MIHSRFPYLSLPLVRSVLPAFLYCSFSVCSAASSQDVINWFRQAQVYERMGRTDQAVLLYRRIWQEMPTRSDAAIRGAQLLLDLNRGSEAVAWLAEATTTSPQEPLLWVEYGDALDRIGSSDAADSVWSVGARVAANPTLLYLGVSDRLIGRGALPRALLWASTGSEVSGNPAAFSRRLFDTHLALGHAASAARYASASVGGSAEQVQEIVEAIGQIGFSRAARDSMATVATDMSNSDSAMAGRALLAAELNLAAGRRQEVAGLYARSARASREPANLLLALAGRLEERGYSDVAAGLYEQIVAEYPLTPLAYRSAYLAATRYEESGRPERALSLYRWLVERGRSGYEDGARLALGRLLLESGDVSAAKEQFTSVSRTGRTPSVRREGLFGLAECALRLGRLDEAETQWRALAENTGAFSNAPKAQLRLAELAMYRGDAKAMQERCREVLDEQPSSDEANDCLALTGILAEAGQDTAAWVWYGKLRYQLDSGRSDSVLSGIHRLAGSPLLSRGMLLAAQAELARSHPEAAAESLVVVIGRFGDTPIGEEAQWKLAELYRVHLADGRRALEAYEEFLRRYPDSVYTGPARRWVRGLRDKSGAT